MKVYLVYSDDYDYTDGLVIETAFLVPYNFDKEAEEELIERYFAFNAEQNKKHYEIYSYT